MMNIDVKDKNMGIKSYKELNEIIRNAIKNGEKEIVLENINGHRYIGANIKGDAKIKIHGVPGNDLAFTMDGLEIEIFGNGQDGIGNTMSNGKLIIHGNAGDICGYAMRGGKIFIEKNVGYRSGIHMKQYGEDFPLIMIGRKGGDFLGEYMAGGVIIVLGLHNDQKPPEEKESPIGYLTGTGMHGGAIFVRGPLENWKLGKEVNVSDLSEQEQEFIEESIKEYAKDLEKDLSHIKPSEFKKLYPGSTRPYGKLYAY